MDNEPGTASNNRLSETERPKRHFVLSFFIFVLWTLIILAAVVALIFGIVFFGCILLYNS